MLLFLCMHIDACSFIFPVTAMMTSNTPLPTLFEHLPMELVLRLFDYFSLQEILRAFSGLNSSLDSMITSMIDRSHVIKYNDATASHLLRLFPTQIGRLVIINSKAVDFTPLINLRSLTLRYATSTQLDSIRPRYFPMLEILHLYVGEGSSAVQQLLSVILSNGFPRLRTCTAVGVGTLTVNKQWSGSPALSSLYVEMQTAHDYEQLRSLCPRLPPLTSLKLSRIHPLKGIVDFHQRD